jgi:hypothetical protein
MGIKDRKIGFSVRDQEPKSHSGISISSRKGGKYETVF